MGLHGAVPVILNRKHPPQPITSAKGKPRKRENRLTTTMTYGMIGQILLAPNGLPL